MQKLDNIYNMIATIEEIKEAICKNEIDGCIVDDIIGILDKRNILTKEELIGRWRKNAKNKIH